MLEQLILGLNIGMLLAGALWLTGFGVSRIARYYMSHDNVITEAMWLAACLIIITIVLLGVHRA